MAPSPAPLLAYFTDVEGHWSKLEGSARGNPALSLDPHGHLQLAPGTRLVFGGDAIDRGPHGRRIVQALLDAHRRHPGQVVLLAGNRDINKIRLRRELSGFPPQRTPDPVRSAPRHELLRWIFSNTMGASLAFESRQRELTEASLPDHPEAVVDSFLADLAPDGPLSLYLRSCQLAFRDGPNLFVHGSVTPENLGRVPGLPAPLPSVDEWINALNRWYRQQIEAYAAGEYGTSGDPAWAPLVAYQAPQPGARTNQASVVYARPTDESGNPSLPHRTVVEALRREGIQRVIVGHSPVGDCPALVRTEGFELLVADNSYSPVEAGCKVLLRGEQVEIEGPSRFEGGREVVRAVLTLGEASPVGRRLREGGWLVKGQLPGGDFLLYRGLPGFRVEHRAVSPQELAGLPTEDAWPDSPAP
ncbi:MAG: hypothetical protein MUF64_07595 [Polyangiaceae bacterium]|jgi:hypothetical protein|nr:hypothetical protein [Polyangiaceae bacterium]